ncbi:efflux RND transporter periplasmic adaptor subunit [Candidatus Uabimicrobium sp. HlEnr_7]|uniref:efflux RND transporter periplasmic adaptor subunit n=1 Tax=Candidatus Uabimicrobium helgolandensis TaxID=3095367 RepID=UPI0035571ACF
MKYLSFFCYAVVFFTVFWGIQKHLQTDVKIKNISPTILPVSVIKCVVKNQYQTEHVYSGYIEPYLVSELSFEREGKIKEVYANEGAYVSKGSPLAKLSTVLLEMSKQQISAEKNAAEAKLKEMLNGERKESIDVAKAVYSGLVEQVSFANKKLDRFQHLYSKGTIAIEEYETTQSNLKVLKTAQKAAHKQLQKLLAGTREETIAQQNALIKSFQIQLRKINVHIKNSLLTSPHSGIVSFKKATPGKFVQPNQTNFRIIEVHKLKAKIGLTISMAKQIKLGRLYDVEIANSKYKMMALTKLPEVDKYTNTIIFIFTLTQKKMNIYPGELARIKLLQTYKKRGIWLPITSLLKGNRGLWSCFTLKKNSKVANIYTVVKKDVEIIHVKDNEVFVRGDFLKTTIVIKNGVHRVTPLQQVNIANEPYFH